MILKHPFLFEVNTWVWLNDLSKTYKRQINLSNVPGEVWDHIASNGFQYVWLMGVWERSPAGIQIAMEHEDMVNHFRSVLDDFVPEDVVGSPYCIKNYLVDEHLGGSKGLETVREALNIRGIKLILDFVPNHVAPDHPWTYQHPEYFISGSIDEFFDAPNEFYQGESTIFAKARDPYYPPWPDVIQLNAFSEGYRRASLKTISKIAGQCDGIRCDMAMLLTNRIFRKTWGDKAGPVPSTEYWDQIIPLIKKEHPNFLFIGEVYWDMEWEMLQQGFDYCYDKRLYDRMMGETAENIRDHLTADIHFQSKLVRFIENHDEPRVSAKFNELRNLTTAITFSTLPGMRLFHEGQFEGRKIKVPVFLGRRPEEQSSEYLAEMYKSLLNILDQPLFHNGDWKLCKISGWDDNQSFLDMIGWAWTDEDNRVIIVVNFSENSSQGMIKLPWSNFKNEEIVINDPFNQNRFERNAEELLRHGLYVDIPPFGNHIMFIK